MAPTETSRPLSLRLNESSGIACVVPAGPARWTDMLLDDAELDGRFDDSPLAADDERPCIDVRAIQWQEVRRDRSQDSEQVVAAQRHGNENTIERCKGASAC